MEQRWGKFRSFLRFLWEGETTTVSEEARPTEAKIHQNIYAMPTAMDFKRQADRQQLSAIIAALLCSLILGSAYVLTGWDNIALPVAMIVAVAVPMLLWRYPIFGLYLVLACVCLFDVFPRSFTDAVFDNAKFPLWFNINTIIALYTYVDPHVIPVNLFEIIVVLMGLMSLVRMSYYKTMKFRAGDLLAPIAVYIAFVTIGWILGITSGGDFNLSLQEVRAQFYFLYAYCLAVNMVENRSQVRTVFWITALCIGLKGILYTFRRYVTLAGQPLDDQGVGSHEEAFMFDVFLMMLLCCVFSKSYTKLQWAMWALLPLIILGNIATNRRTGTAALVIALPIFLIGCYAAFPRRRINIVIFAAMTASLGYLYYQAFKNSSLSIAQPARAIHSYFEPDARDASSNLYRDAENISQFATIKDNLLGYGYGKRFYHAVDMRALLNGADVNVIYPLWDILPHNQILWVWMRTGTQGFFAFWIMASLIVIRSMFFLKRPDLTNEDRALGLLTLTIMPMLLVFAVYDVQLSNFRNMLLTGIFIGTSCSGFRGEFSSLLFGKANSQEPSVSLGLTPGIR